jgi:peroxiredoxin
MHWNPGAPKVGGQAADLSLLDESGKPVRISSLARGGALLALVFRGPYDGESLSFLREYRDRTLALRMADVSLCGIAPADPSALAFMRAERGLGFPLLADEDGSSLPRWGLLDETGLFLLDKNLIVKQRALGKQVSADDMLIFIRRRRGGARPEHRRRDRLAHALRSISQVLSQRRLAR